MDDSRQLLIKGIEYLRVDVSPAQIDLLLAFVSLIQKWNKAYNLTAIRDRDEMLRLHILDSLAILPYVTGQKIIDVGDSFFTH